MPRFTAAEELRIQQQAAQVSQAMNAARDAGGGGSFAAALGASSSSRQLAPAPMYAGTPQTTVLAGPGSGLMAPLDRPQAGATQSQGNLRLQFNNPFVQQRYDHGLL